MRTQVVNTYISGILLHRVYGRGLSVFRDRSNLEIAKLEQMEASQLPGCLALVGTFKSVVQFRVSRGKLIAKQSRSTMRQTGRVSGHADDERTRRKRHAATPS